jgi:opacity protein-like surface antigen
MINHTHTTRKYTAAALGVAALTLALSVAPAQEDQWKFSTAPLFWATSIEGDMTVRGTTVDVDLPFEDLADVTEFGFATHLELQKGKFGLYANPSYTKLEGDGQAPGGPATFEQDFWLVHGGIFFNLVEPQGDRPLTLDLTLGVRYLNVETELTVPLDTLTSSTKLLDPTVGLRMKKNLTEKISLNVAGDVGGFGISEGDTSDFSWQALALVGYDINEKFTILGGYRGVGIETSEGSGVDEKGFDLVMHGLMLGVQVNW